MLAQAMFEIGKHCKQRPCWCSSSPTSARTSRTTHVTHRNELNSNADLCNNKIPRLSKYSAGDLHNRIIVADNNRGNKSINSAAPLDKISVVNAERKVDTGYRWKGKRLFLRIPGSCHYITVSGGLGKHVITIKGKKNNATEV